MDQIFQVMLFVLGVAVWLVILIGSGLFSFTVWRTAHRTIWLSAIELKHFSLDRLFHFIDELFVVAFGLALISAPFIAVYLSIERFL